MIDGGRMPVADRVKVRHRWPGTCEMIARRRKRCADGEAHIMLLRATSRRNKARQAGRVAIILLMLAVAIVAVGGLTMRLGPRWPRRLFFRGPPGIVIHHSATGSTVEGHRVDAERIGRWHEQRGFAAEYRHRVYTIGYHYVILPDGAVQQGRPEWMVGAHTYGYNDYLGICLVGNFDSGANPAGAQQPARPTGQQMSALKDLLGDLMTKYRLDADDIYGHGELGSTACPGDRFPMEQLQSDLEAAKGSSAREGGGNDGDTE
ncbi:MAG: peptidoglycan recognition family protein [Armatimonadota bacterium]